MTRQRSNVLRMSPARARARAALLIVSTLALASGCVHRPTVAAGPGAASHAFGEPVSTTVTAVIARPLATTWAAMFEGEEIPIHEMLRPTDKIPGVSRTQILQGERWHTEGAYRHVWLTTGAKLQITHLIKPNYYAYRTWDLPPPLAGRVDHIRGEWWFEPHPEGTRVVWQYTMIVTSGIAKSAIKRYLRRHMNPFMQDGLERIKAEIERRTEGAPGPAAAGRDDAPAATSPAEAPDDADASATAEGA